MLEHALKYQSLGWPVFPLHGIVDGQCTCGNPDCGKSSGKHPRTKHGHHEATTNEQQIIDWWAEWPDSNIGVPTGAVSGIIALDVDKPELAADFLSKNKSPKTAMQRTGREGGQGRHVIFKYPGHHVKSISGVVPGLDSKGDGGYIVVAPSIHYSGNRYEWMQDPDAVPLADAPKWWLDLVNGQQSKTRKVPVVKDGDKIQEGGRDEYLYSRANELVWANLNYAPCLAALREINATELSPPVDDSQVIQKLDSAWKNKAAAQEKKDMEKIGGEMADAILENYNKSRSADFVNKARKTKRLTMPNIMPEYGLIKDIADWILRTSMHPWPELAVAAAVSFLSVVAGRKYKTYTGLTLNVYMSAILPSGQGKNHSRSCIKQLISACGMNDNYGEGIGSGPGLIDALVKNPTRIYLLDEFGYMLERVMSDKAQSYEKQIISNLMTLYTNNMQQFKTADLADSTNSRSGKTIESPFLSIYGSATPDQFFGAFKSRYAASGGMARFLVVYPDAKWVDQQDVNTLEPPPQFIVDQIKEILEGENPSGNIPLDCAPVIIEADKQTKKAWFSIRDTLKDRIMENDVSGSVYSLPLIQI